MNEYPQIELSEWTKVDAMPDTQNCLHGDFQPGNIIMTGGQHYWIDLGWLSQGWYMMDLAHLYKMMIEDSMIPQVRTMLRHSTANCAHTPRWIWLEPVICIL